MTRFGFTHSTPSDEEILILWRGGKDTCDISKQLWVPEYHVACRLPSILARDRQDQEWNFDGLVNPTVSQAAEKVAL